MFFPNQNKTIRLQIKILVSKSIIPMSAINKHTSSSKFNYIAIKCELVNKFKYHPPPKCSTPSFLCCLNSEPPERLLPRFPDEKSPEGGAEDGRGIGDNAIVTVPSGPYFLGLPLFFFPVVSDKPPLTGKEVT